MASMDLSNGLREGKRFGELVSSGFNSDHLLCECHGELHRQDGVEGLSESAALHGLHNSARPSNGRSQ